MSQDHRPAGLILQGRHLTKTFGAGATQTRAVDDVSFDLHAGQMVVLMGPSGSGKSTLLALLSGLVQPTSGQVVALGQDLWKLSDHDRQEFRLRHCGFVFQRFNHFPAMSARQQLEIVLRLGELVSAGEARRRAEKLLVLLGLGNKIHHRPAELSGGEQQRVAIARALVKNPTLFFADEPTASLDWARGSQVVQLLGDAAHERKAGVLMVSHDPRLCSSADEVYQLEDGHLRKSVCGPRPDHKAPSPERNRSNVP